MKRKNTLYLLFLLGLVNACVPNENLVRSPDMLSSNIPSKSVQQTSIPDEYSLPEKSVNPTPIKTDIPEEIQLPGRVTVRGNVYDVNGSLLDGAIITARSVNSDITWSGQTKPTIDGYYLLKNVPVGQIEITVTKEGWTKRSVILEAKNSSDNIFSFKGSSGIQDEPEIETIKVNGKNHDYSLLSLTSLSDENLEIEIEFSEPVTRSDIENYLKVSSQNFGDREKFIINKDLKGTSFTWSEDGKKVIFKYDAPLVNKEQEKEVEYTIEFTSPFHDKSGKAAIKSKYFKIYTSNSDLITFSLKNKISKELKEYTDITDLCTFTGTVYDINHNPAKDALVTATSITPYVKWDGENQITTDGKYSYRAGAGFRILITVTKDGWTTRQRSEVLKCQFEDPSQNTFNFGSTDGNSSTGDNIYAIQDEPEITLLKINGKQVHGAFSGDSFNGKTGNTAPANLGITGLASDSFKPNLYGLPNTHLEIEMTFSEPVLHTTVEDYFRVSSQDFEDKDSLILNRNSEGVSFNWSKDDKICTFKYDKPLIANKEGNEARYIINFTSPFNDLRNNEAIPYRYFRFSTSQINDFATFSVKNSN